MRGMELLQKKFEDGLAEAEQGEQAVLAQRWGQQQQQQQQQQQRQLLVCHSLLFRANWFPGAALGTQCAACSLPLHPCANLV